MAITIVAEIGSNHCGSISLAFVSIDRAYEAGCNAVKFQLFQAETLYANSTSWSALRPYEVPARWIPQLKRYANDTDLDFICTPFSLSACEALEGFVDAVKISAYDLTYDALVGRAAQLRVPVILSTAMATMAEVIHAVDVARNAGGNKTELTLLHGVAQYPCRLEDMNLRALTQMKEQFSWCKVGISDHTLGSDAALACVCLGGTMIEKHFKLPGVESPDAGHSIEPEHMGELVRRVREMEKAMGTGNKEGPLPCEMELFRTARRSNAKPLRE